MNGIPNAEVEVGAIRGIKKKIIENRKNIHIENSLNMLDKSDQINGMEIGAGTGVGVDKLINRIKKTLSNNGTPNRGVRLDFGVYKLHIQNKNDLEIKKNNSQIKKKISILSKDFN